MTGGGFHKFLILERISLEECLGRTILCIA